MSIKSVGIIGAGAVGSYVIWGLSEKKDISLSVIAKGERAERLKAEGCLINGKTYHPEVLTPEEAKGVDLLVVSLKYGALPAALDDIKAATGDNTTVMSLMNGVDSEEIIAGKIGSSHMLYSLIKVASSHKEGQGYVFNPDTTLGIIYGELNAPFDSERVRMVKELFERGNIHFRVTKHIKEEIWCKFRLNVCNNLPQAILGPINDIIHLLSFLSPFWAVPVLPATEYPVTPAFMAVPSSTVFLRYLLKSFDVEAVIVCLTRLALYSFTTSPLADSILFTICGW